MRLCICVPSYGDWAADFGHSLALLMADLARDESIASVRLSRCESTIIAEGRSDLVKDALSHDATHLLFCDADMRFRFPNVQSLMARDLDVVGCTYPKRRPPHEMTAQAMDGARIAPGIGVVEAAHIGFGLALIKASVFERVPLPWFAHPWLEADKRFVSEDIWFCRHSRANGIPTHVDREASRGVGHVGKLIYEADKWPCPTSVN